MRTITDKICAFSIVSVGNLRSSIGKMIQRKQAKSILFVEKIIILLIYRLFAKLGAIQ